MARGDKKAANRADCVAISREPRIRGLQFIDSAAFYQGRDIAALRKPRRTPRRGRGYSDLLAECMQARLIRQKSSPFTRRALCFHGDIAAFNSPFPFALSETPPPARAAKSAHTRGAPHSAKPNAAGGGCVAAHACCPLRGQHGAAQSPRFRQARRLNCPCTPDLHKQPPRGVLPDANIPPAS